jgi:hypothetical protein
LASFREETAIAGGGDFGSAGPPLFVDEEVVVPECEAGWAVRGTAPQPYAKLPANTIKKTHSNLTIEFPVFNLNSPLNNLYLDLQ